MSEGRNRGGLSPDAVAATAITNDAPARSEDGKHDLPEGCQVGEYIVVRKIGAGAMGTVYEAAHPVIGKRAAIKVISQRLSGDSDAVARFVQEARSVNQIGHPNIVDVFSFGTLEDGRCYFVMELLTGASLGDLLKRGPLSVTRAIDLLLPVCGALAAAHAKAVIHRDLKPDNVFICQLTSGKMVKLLDFGLAKLTTEREPTILPTRTGMMMGTPGYVSPEQARGKNVDYRTDIYALGAMTFEMLAGHVPFLADTAIDMVSMHLSHPPPSISELRPDAPSQIDALIIRMLAKRADDRPSLEDVERTLRAVRARLMFSSSRRAPTATSPHGVGALAEELPKELSGSFDPTLTSADPVRNRRKKRWIVIPIAVAAVAVGVVLAGQLAGSSNEPLVSKPPPTQPSPAVASEPSPAPTPAVAADPLPVNESPPADKAVPSSPAAGLATGAPEKDPNQETRRERRRTRKKASTAGNSSDPPKPTVDEAERPVKLPPPPPPTKTETSDNFDDRDYMLDPFKDRKK